MNPIAAAALLSLLMLAVTAPATAGQSRHGAQPFKGSTLTASTYAEGISLDEAVARMEKRYDARVVRAEEKQRDGRRVYRIRLLGTDGRVFEVTVDAASGQVE